MVTVDWDGIKSSTHPSGIAAAMARHAEPMTAMSAVMYIVKYILWSLELKVVLSPLV